MAAITASRANFPTQKCSLYAPLPIMTSPDQKIRGDWCQVAVKQRNAKGDFITNLQANPLQFTYHLQTSTGDLYAMKGSSTPAVVALKAFSMGLVIYFYMLGMMGANFIKIALDITSIFWRVIPQLVQEIFQKSPIAACGNAFMAISWDIPHAVVQDIWRIYCSPLYAAGMMFACLFTVVCPMYGRKWLGKIETSWHEGVSFRKDIRYRSFEKGFFKQKFVKQISDIASGKLFYLGYCMAKRGNIKSDMVGGKPKYELLLVK